MFNHLFTSAINNTTVAGVATGSTSIGNSGLCWTVFAYNRDTAVPAEGNGDLQTLICVLGARPRRCLTLSNPVSWQNWMVANLGYTLRMKTLFRGWPVMIHDTHTRRRRRITRPIAKNMTEDTETIISQQLTHCRPAAQISLASWRLRSSSMTLSSSAAYAGWFSRTSSDTRLDTWPHTFYENSAFYPSTGSTCLCQHQLNTIAQ